MEGNESISLLNEAADGYAAVLELYPDYQDARTYASGLYHDRLFNYGKAFSIDSMWIARHQDDPSVELDFTENHFTTARFAECKKRLVEQIENSSIAFTIRVALRGLAVANSIALGEAGSIPEQLAAMLRSVSSQSDSFRVGWTFSGTKYFIAEYPPLARYRDWLLRFFSALEEKDRDTIVERLRKVKAEFQ